jgi:hypothetical protein
LGQIFEQKIKVAPTISNKVYPTESVLSTSLSTQPTNIASPSPPANVANPPIGQIVKNTSSPHPTKDSEVRPGDYRVDWSVYREVTSVSTADGKYFGVDWGKGIQGYNPSFVAHPTNKDQWIVIAQMRLSDGDLKKHLSAQIACNASFVNGNLACAEPPATLPIQHTPPCKDNDKRGPHDARTFHGPNASYILYGSDSAYSCLGMWLQDVRMLLHDYSKLTSTIKLFKDPVDVQKPTAYGQIEKNYFLFWDDDDNVYVHFEIAGGRHATSWRQFAALHSDGSVGPNLAPIAANTDDTCMSKYMPSMGVRNATGAGPVEYEAVHQASNSLSITLCKRSDPACSPTQHNTYIMTIFQHKAFYSWHAEYHPYVMLFQQRAPFAIHAISQKGIWINGRGTLSQQTDAYEWRGQEREMPKAHSEMFFVTNISWKRHGQMYHGFIDDELFVGFGIEDTRSAGIDIVAGDLLRDMAYC